jgi:alpha-1,3/alpha-1,6-mannosyltransferase
MNTKAQVIFMPSIADATRNAILKQSTCLIYTPADEHFGIVPIEAMSFGVPVIAINSGGPCETIIDGVTGYLCEPKNTVIGAQLLQMLSNRAEVKKISEAARKHVLQRFSIKRFGDELESFIYEFQQ